MEKRIAGTVVFLLTGILCAGWVVSYLEARRGPVPESPETPSEEPATPDAPRIPEGYGSLSGRATFEGPVPAPIAIDPDVAECHAARGEVPSATVGSDGGLAGVIVEVLRVPEGKWRRAWPSVELAIHNRDCMFEPRVLVVPVGADLQVLNHDTVTHNTRIDGRGPTLAAGDPPQSVRIGTAGMKEMSCNFHAWMQGWVYAAGSPYYAITGPDGHYRIDDLPSGTYVVRFVHPTQGRREVRDVAIRPDAVESRDVLFGR